MLGLEYVCTWGGEKQPPPPPPLSLWLVLLNFLPQSVTTLPKKLLSCLEKTCAGLAGISGDFNTYNTVINQYIVY